MIEIENLGVKIGPKDIVAGVSFHVEPGRVTTIIGPNGSGKTTALKALSGDLAYSGAARIAGRDINRMKAWEMASVRAVLPQISHLSFPFTVREVVRIGLTSGYSGASDRDADELAEEALRRVDLDGFAGRFYQELSGGEQQRVQLARVLCQVWEPVTDGEPRYLFLDEPISSLDIRHQLAIMDIAVDFAGKGGGVLAILHDLNLTAMYSDRVVIMHRGRCKGFGPPDEVLRDDLLQEVFGCRLQVGVTPPAGTRFVPPQSAR